MIKLPSPDKSPEKFALPLDAVEVIVVPEGILIKPEPEIAPIVSSPASKPNIVPEAQEIFVFPSSPLAVNSPPEIVVAPV